MDRSQSTVDAKPRIVKRSTEHEIPPTSLRTSRNAAASGPPTAVERRLLKRLLQALGGPAVAVTLWSGDEFLPPAAPPVAHLRIADRGTLWRLLVDPQFQFGEAYSSGRITVEGDLFQLVCELSRAGNRAQGSAVANGLTRVLHRPHRTSISAARESIHHHYDLGNEFYRLWLDRQLVYTCAYFQHPAETLEQAQVAKLEHVCRKVWLRPGDRVVEAGCGWGALALHMARRHGARVRAFNISRQQLDYARERAKAEGLTDRVEFVEDDWRNIRGQYDVFMSVGMLEHAGRENYRELGDVIHRCLTRDGRGLIHTIGRNRPRPLDPWIERRIFPGAYPPALSQMTDIFEPRSFSILDVENIRLHYVKTLEHWLQRFEQAADVVRQMFDERFVRAWRLYLASSQAAFEVGSLQLFQVAFAREENNAIPWSRAHLNQAGHSEIRPEAGESGDACHGTR